MAYNVYMGMRKLIILFITFLFFVQPTLAIKIGLQTRVGRTFIGASTEADIIDCRTNKLLWRMEKMKGYEFKPYRNIIAIKIDGQFRKIKSDKIVKKMYQSDNGKKILFSFIKRLNNEQKNFFLSKKICNVINDQVTYETIMHLLL